MTTTPDYSVKLIENTIQDQAALENFKRIKIFLRDLPIIKAGFVFREIVVNSPGSNLKFKHNLKFVPKDIIMTSVTGSFPVTWVYDAFDADFVVYSVASPCTIRVFIGTYGDGVV